MLGWRLLLSAIMIPAFIGGFYLDAQFGPQAPFLCVLAIALAARTEAQLFASPEVLDEAGVEIEAQAEAPVSDQADGTTILATMPITLTTTTPLATIYYTTDGSLPTLASQSGASPLTISLDAVDTALRFFADPFGAPLLSGGALQPVHDADVPFEVHLGDATHDVEAERRVVVQDGTERCGFDSQLLEIR